MPHQYSHRKPIVYDYTLDIRFADLDPFGHLNSTKYLDLVNTSRLLYLERKIGVLVSELIEKQIGFYMTRATQEFLKPVKGLLQVRITTHVEDLQGGKLTIPYQISDVENKRIYSKGVLEYYVIDLKTQRPSEMPEWMSDCFFIKEAR